MATSTILFDFDFLRQKISYYTFLGLEAFQLVNLSCEKKKKKMTLKFIILVSGKKPHILAITKKMKQTPVIKDKLEEYCLWYYTVYRSCKKCSLQAEHHLSSERTWTTGTACNKTCSKCQGSCGWGYCSNTRRNKRSGWAQVCDSVLPSPGKISAQRLPDFPLWHAEGRRVIFTYPPDRLTLSI